MASSSSSISHRRTSSSDDRSIAQSRSSFAPDGAVVMTHIARVRNKKEEHGKKMVNQYEFQQSLGRGQHGEVHVAIDTITGNVVAIKSVKRKNPKVDRMNQLRKKNLPTSPHLPLTDKLGTTEQKIRKEIAIMKKCNHPHVVKLLEVIDDGLNDKIYMVMEYLGGGEIKWRTEGAEPTLRVSQTRRICRDVILGLEYLHRHGIIHRDIKPANLLWSDDRRMVKIADFGVSHFSYAQQLAAAGQAGYNHEDDILMDEADLFKFAGTPTFLAPEILCDSGADASTSSSMASNLNTLGTSGPGGTGATTPRKKPTITKAVDIWALGVTLYALLFGRMPFTGEREWAIYTSIVEDDWTVLDTMGSDRIPVGGRFQPKPPPGEETEGYLVVSLLDGFFQKDPNKRITLDGVKHHEWILHDMPDGHQWLRQTAMEESLAVTDDETSSAVSSVKFRWPRSLAKGLYSFIRNVRPQRSFRRHPLGTADGRDPDRVGTRSMPAYNQLSRQRSVAQSIAIGQMERDKTKHHRHHHHHSSQLQNKSSIDVRTNIQAGSSRNVSGIQQTQIGGASCLSSRPLHSSTPAAEGSASQPRRGSIPGQPTVDMLQIPAPQHAGSSSRLSSPRATRSGSDSVYLNADPAQSVSRVQSTEAQSLANAPTDRPRSRLSVLTKWWWRPASATWGASPGEVSTSTLPSGATSPLSPTTPPAADGSSNSHRQLHVQHQPVRDLSARRSEDAFHQRGGNPQFSLAMRAASWGEVGQYGGPPDDRTSIYSGDRADDALDNETFLIGAGGVAQSPVSSVPSGVLSTVSSTLSLGPPVLSAAHALLQRIEGSDTLAVPDPAAQDPNALQRQSQYRSHATSPLAQPLYESREAGGSRSSSTFEQYESSSSEEEEVGSRTTSDCEQHTPSMRQLYQEEDEESSSEENVHLEVRTRRPSASVLEPMSSPTQRRRDAAEDRTQTRELVPA